MALTLAAVTADVVLASNDPLAEGWLPGIRVFPDVHRHSGGLAGVHAVVAEGRDVLVVAWDMPFVSPEILRALMAAAQAHAADVVVPASDSPHGIEPFCAYYAARVAETLDQFFASGGGAARDFVRRVTRLHVLSPAEVAALGDPHRLFFSVNTAADLERARAMANARE